MIIQMDRPFANDHLDGPGLANDHLEWLASCKWSSAWICLLQMIDRIEWPLANDHLDGSFSKYHPFFSLFIFSSRDQTPKNSRIIGQYTHNILLSSSFHPQKYELKVPKLGPTCQVHLVQFLVVITLLRTWDCSKWFYWKKKNLINFTSILSILKKNLVKSFKHL